MEKENKMEIGQIVTIINNAIIQQQLVDRLLNDLTEQIKVIRIDTSCTGVHLADGLEILAEFYGAEIQKRPEFHSDKYDEYFFTVDGIEYYQLNPKEGAEV